MIIVRFLLLIASPVALAAGPVPAVAAQLTGSLSGSHAGSPTGSALYNQGVQAYRESRWDDAVTAFREAAASQEDALAAKARYNLGNTFYAQAVQQLGQSTAKESSKAPAANPADLLSKAIQAYDACLRLSPDDDDARFNLENAQRLIDKIEQKKEEDQQKEPSSKDEPQQEKDDKDEQKNEDDKDSQSPSSENQESQEGQSDQKQEPEQEGDEGDSKDRSQDPSEKEKPSPEKAPEKAPEDASPEPTPPPSGKLSSEGDPDDSQSPDPPATREGQPPLPDEMTSQEAQKLLQAIRDREMLRRLRIEASKRSRRMVVPRDW